MNSHFAFVDGDIEVRLSPTEVAFLSDVPQVLGGLGDPTDDPGAARLSPPVYLDDPEAESEWRRLSDSELEASRRADRAAFETVISSVALAGKGDDVDDGANGEDSVGTALISRTEADAFIRVVNEVRLVLGSRWGIDTADDYEDLRPEAADVLSFLGWLVSDMAEVLEEALDHL